MIKYDWLTSHTPKVLPLRSGIPLSEGHTVWFRPAQTFRMSVVDSNEKVVHSADVNLDEYGLRRTPQPNSSKKFHLFFSGCSFTFGDLVNDDQTVASQTAQILPEWNVVNLGRSGASVFESLYLWQNYKVTDLAVPSRGIHVFTLIDPQFERIVPTWRTYHWMKDNRPLYHMDNSKLAGPMFSNATWKWRWMKWINSMGLTEYWLRLTSWFIKYEMKDTDEAMADYLLELKKAYLDQYPDGRFVVTYFFYGHSTAEKLAPYLRERGIEFWPPRKVIEDSSHHVPQDGHPSAKSYKVQADYLATWIKSKASAPVPGTP